MFVTFDVLCRCEEPREGVSDTDSGTASESEGRSEKKAKRGVTRWDRNRKNLRERQSGGLGQHRLCKRVRGEKAQKKIREKRGRKEKASKTYGGKKMERSKEKCEWHILRWGLLVL